jgi:hypothetical protein
MPAMAIMVDGFPETPSGFKSISWLDQPKLRLAHGSDCRRRTDRWIRGIVLHTTKGIPGGKDRRPQDVRPGLGPSVEAGLRCARYWSQDGAQAGAHLVVDHDGTVACCADLVRDAAFHCRGVYPVTIGIEIYQGNQAELYQGQLDVVVRLCDWLTRRLGIQRQIPGHAYRGSPVRRLLVNDGLDFVGVYGHRDADANRGAGDPGSHVMRLLGAAGYEDWDLDDEEDLIAWRIRQRALGLRTDGVPGPITVEALKRAGHRHGLWVKRPMDTGPELVA